MNDSLNVTFRRAANFIGRYLTAAGHALVTFTVGIASSRRRHTITLLARDAGYRGYPPVRLPEVALSTLSRADTAVILPSPEVTDGNLSLLELVALTRLVRERNPRAIFEIGTFDGRSALAMAANAPEAALFTLDLPPDHPTRMALAGGERVYVDKPASGALLAGTPESARVKQLYGDSATFDFSSYKSDVVFVDGSHAYHYVLQDSVSALSMLRDGHGLIVWHDYGMWEGVTRALNHLLATDPRFQRLRYVRGTTLAILEV